MRYAEVTEANVQHWADLDLKMFPGQSPADCLEDCREALSSRKQAAFLCMNDGGHPVAFVNVSLRTDYVEGTDGPPVGFLEAIYVESAYRLHGIAKELAALAEKWAAKNGCTVMASDTELTNVDSQAFHAHIGYTEVNRIVAFVKKIS